MFMVRTSNKVVGYVDAVQGTSVCGWAANKGSLGDVLDILVFADGQQIGQGPASQHRPDLMAAGYGNGNHGFTIPVTNIPSKQFALSVMAVTRSNLGQVRRTQLASASIVELARSLFVKALTIDLPDPVSEYCRLVAEGRAEQAPSIVLSETDLFLSDELFPKTLLSFTNKSDLRE